MSTETSTEVLFTLTRKVFEPVETHFTPGERSMVAWISTDCIDHERDVVVSSGVDYKTFFLGKTPEEGNPCVLAFHDFGRWPLGRCEWVKIKQSRAFNGLYAKTIFDDDPETEAVWRKIKSRSLRGISIGFRPPEDLKPGEWGPPTREELVRRPDWKGAERVIRRCVLLEYSVCSLPMNPQALVAAVNKGVHRPVFSPQPKAARMSDADADLAHPPDTFTPTNADPETSSVTSEGGTTSAGPPDAEIGKAEEEHTAVAPETDTAPNGDEVETEVGSFQRFDHVQVKAPHYNGGGRIESFSTRGHVPDVAEDMLGTADDPAARIQCYKPMGDGHLPTHDYIAARLVHLTKLAEPMRPPSPIKTAAKRATTPSRSQPTLAGPEDNPLPQVVVQSDQEVRAELIAKLNEMLSPDGFRRIAREEAERAAGFV
ncbi:HK97 family phage prohead protease [Singulisphaera sp. GP187]|uniref:HK97 family phage prohead protease n=1 Tax=Singulisphaera sp. GP187 TaxID=1882752 RepID=UPI0013563917|nr:HK97 family phage prohead protease [Singulisphaera sp. GP187]